MINEEVITRLKNIDIRGALQEDYDALYMAIKSIEALDKLESIIVEQLDKSTDQKESMTLRWVLDKIAEVEE